MSYEQMYQEQILDHYKNPRNFGKLDSFDIHYFDTNPLCGDEIEFFVKLDNEGKISEIRFNSKGCAISKAAASLLTLKLKEKRLEEARIMQNEDVFSMLGIEISPMRVKCALLGLKTLQKGIYKYLAKGEKNE